MLLISNKFWMDEGGGGGGWEVSVGEARGPSSRGRIRGVEQGGYFKFLNSPERAEQGELSSFVHLLFRPPQYGPKMTLAYRLNAISQGPRNSRIPGPNPLPLPLIMDMHTSKTLCKGLYKS